MLCSTPRHAKNFWFKKEWKFWLNLQKVSETTSTNISENMQNKGVFTIRLFNDAAFLHILHNLNLDGKVIMHGKNSERAGRDLFESGSNDP